MYYGRMIIGKPDDQLFHSYSTTSVQAVTAIGAVVGLLAYADDGATGVLAGALLFFLFFAYHSRDKS